MPAAQTVTLDELRQRIERLSLVGVDVSPLLRAFVQICVSETKMRFNTSTTPDGAAWAPLVLRKGKPLVDKGILMASLTGSGPGSIREYQQKGFTYGTNIDYAHVHNDGMTIHAKNGPFLYIPIPGTAVNPRTVLNKSVAKRDKHKAAMKATSDPKKLASMAKRLVKIEAEVKEKAGKYQRGETGQRFILKESVTVPQRQFLGWNEKMMIQCEEALAEFAVRKLGGTFGANEALGAGGY